MKNKTTKKEGEGEGGREVSRCYSNAINQRGEREKNLIHRFLTNRHENGGREGDVGRDGMGGARQMHSHPAQET